MVKMTARPASRQKDFIVIGDFPARPGWLGWLIRLGLWAVGAVGLWLLGSILIGMQKSSTVNTCFNSIGFYQKPSASEATGMVDKPVLKARTLAP